MVVAAPGGDPCDDEELLAWFHEPEPPCFPNQTKARTGRGDTLLQFTLLALQERNVRLDTVQHLLRVEVATDWLPVKKGHDRKSAKSEKKAGSHPVTVMIFA
jgi:hypothetical protein